MKAPDRRLAQINEIWNQGKNIMAIASLDFPNRPMKYSTLNPLVSGG